MLVTQNRVVRLMVSDFIFVLLDIDKRNGEIIFLVSK